MNPILSQDAAIRARVSYVTTETRITDNNVRLLKCDNHWVELSLVELSYGGFSWVKLSLVQLVGVQLG